MMQDEVRRLKERLAAAEGELAEANDALRMAKEDAAAELAENNAALAAASAELQELRDVHADVSSQPPHQSHQNSRIHLISGLSVMKRIDIQQVAAVPDV